jgi:hypothetical protein
MALIMEAHVNDHHAIFHNERLCRIIHQRRFKQYYNKMKHRTQIVIILSIGFAIGIGIFLVDKSFSMDGVITILFFSGIAGAVSLVHWIQNRKK